MNKCLTSSPSGAFEVRAHRAASNWNSACLDSVVEFEYFNGESRSSISDSLLSLDNANGHPQSRCRSLKKDSFESDFRVCRKSLVL